MAKVAKKKTKPKNGMSIPEQRQAIAAIRSKCDSNAEIARRLKLSTATVCRRLKEIDAAADTVMVTERIDERAEMTIRLAKLRKDIERRMASLGDDGHDQWLRMVDRFLKTESQIADINNLKSINVGHDIRIPESAQKIINGMNQLNGDRAAAMKLLREVVTPGVN